MFIESGTAEKNAAMAAAAKLCAAARTAPKTRGIDHIQTAVLTDGDKDALAAEMRRLHEEENWPDMFVRDAACVEKSLAIVLIGTYKMPRGLNCKLCGYDDCGKCLKDNGTCVFDMIDLGIALGSAAASAADERVDSRIMYSIGRVAARMGLLPQSSVIMGVPVSVTGKSPFFDRG